MSPVLAALLDWIETPDWGASADYLKNHPELLSDAASEILARLMATAQTAHNSVMAREFTRHYLLIALVRREGISEAYSRLMQSRLE